LSKSMRARW